MRLNVPDTGVFALKRPAFPFYGNLDASGAFSSWKVQIHKRSRDLQNELMTACKRPSYSPCQLAFLLSAFMLHVSASVLWM